MPIDELTGEGMFEHPVGDEAAGPTPLSPGGDSEAHGELQCAVDRFDGAVAETSADIGADPAYQQVVLLMQEGRWLEAAAGLEALQARYPGSPDLQQVRQLLALRLSAERNWSGSGQRWTAALKAPLIRVLIAANLLLWLLLGILCLLSR
ncbi:MAG: hypothetical protein K6V36_06690 [Anaerolineae bacterium]|nr:hypothetical protein [Anaerolineae bacterium]